MEIDDVRKIGVVGAGVMGHGIAQVCARGGYEVVLVDVSDEVLAKALQLIRSGPFGLEKLVQKGKMSVEEAEKVMGRIRATTFLKELEDVDFLIEAVP
ncbi:MAG: 3-hydroxyacyl-CoA dehydrogenase, partial [Candidatus Freyarchaeota archaeon]|nr:3-hydroxyacyl-CoA dehydrogenase [Candidatus Jordarchaeia archaeon]